jgi:hypothetical protein
LKAGQDVYCPFGRLVRSGGLGSLLAEAPVTRAAPGLAHAFKIRVPVFGVFA